MHRGRSCIKQHDIGISQCANPVQKGSTCIEAVCNRKSLHKRGAAGRACTSVTQQEKPAKALHRRKSLHKRGTAQEPGQAWRAKIIMTKQTEQEKAALTQPSHGNNISGETSITIIGGLGNNIIGETTTNHNHLEKIDTVHETVSQYKAHDVIQAQRVDYETGRGHTGDGGAAIRIDMQD